ncbi:MAG: CPBP family glutamic-type intramembrane protease [Verrucomicrobiales bacterium]|nr:CPBP family glutamic-type intramembrane protease [Verrucomicrobiales bacterium]
MPDQSIPVISSLDLPLTRDRIVMLITFVLATVLLIPAHQHIAGGICVAVCIFLMARDEEVKLRRRMGILLGCVILLGICDINPSLADENFLQVGIPFTLVILLPGIIQQFGDRGIIRYRFWPKVWRKHDIIYTILSIPLAWVVLKSYEWGNRTFFEDELFRSWVLPPDPDANEIRRLFIGINLVGVWDELFFVNVCFAMLRSLFQFRLANAVQAVIYTAVLYDMAFDGCGVLIVFAFAWTQGAMFEKSESLLWVLIVHLIVDYFLVAMIVQTYYPGYGLDFLWRKGF